MATTNDYARYFMKKYCSKRYSDGIFDKVKGAVSSGKEKLSEVAEEAKFLKNEIAPLKSDVIKKLISVQSLLAIVIKDLMKAATADEFASIYPKLVKAVKVITDSSSGYETIIQKYKAHKNK